MKQRHLNGFSGGFTLLEVALAIALLLVVTIGTLAGNSLAAKGALVSQTRSEAVRLAREGMEAVESVRAAAFTSIHPGTYHPVSTPSGWNLASGTETLGDYTRQIVISQVYRSLACTEGICEIVNAGGIVDEGSLKAQTKIGWVEDGQNRELVLEALITYWR